MGQLLDTDTALSLLEPHWDTWITEQDFKDISAAGLTHVRCVSSIHPVLEQCRTHAHLYEDCQLVIGQSPPTSLSPLTMPALGPIFSALFLGLGTMASES